MESPCESLFTYKFHFCKETLGYSDFPFFHWKLVFQTYGAFIVLFSGFQPFTNTCPFKGLFWIPRVFSKESLFWLIGMHACPALCELCEICSLHRLGYSLNRLEDFWSHFSAWISLLHYIALQISSYFCLPELWALLLSVRLLAAVLVALPCVTGQKCFQAKSWKIVAHTKTDYTLFVCSSRF